MVKLLSHTKPMTGSLHSSTRRKYKKKEENSVGLLQNDKFLFLMHVHNSVSVKNNISKSTL